MKKVRAVDMFPGSVHVETVVLLSHKKPDGHINVKVEFGEGEGKVPLDNIAKRAESYKPVYTISLSAPDLLGRTTVEKSGILHFRCSR